MPKIPIPDNAIIEDGFYIDPETGLEIAPVEPEGFHVHDDLTFEWVMGKRFEIDRTIANLKEKQRIMNENIERMIKQAERRKVNFDWRFASELEWYVRKELAGKKIKTINSMYGSCALRKQKQRFDVIDEDKAIAWAKEHAPFAVKVTETFLKTTVPGYPDLSEMPKDAVQLVPETEKFTIDTKG